MEKPVWDKKRPKSLGKPKKLSDSQKKSARAMAKKATGSQPLSDREREVLQYVARGHTYKEIGEELYIAPKTVENHVRNILGKLHLSRKQELVRYALEHGID